MSEVLQPGLVQQIGLAEKHLTVTVNVPAAMESDTKVVLVRIEQATIESDDGYIALSEALVQAKRRRDAYECDQRALKKPVTALARAIDAKFQAPIGILDSAIYIGKQKLIAYQNLKRTTAHAPQTFPAPLHAQAPAREEVPEGEVAEALAPNHGAAATTAPTAQRASEAPTRMAEARDNERQVDISGEAVRSGADATLNTLTNDTVACAAAAAVLARADHSSRRVSWQWRVSDFSKVDRKWLMIDEKCVNKLVGSYKGSAGEFLGDGFEVFIENTFGLTRNVWP
jgi:hypothetical protein